MMRFAVFLAFLSFNLLPVLHHVIHRVNLDIAENMRVPPDKLSADTLKHIGHVEIAFFGGDLRMQDNLQQQVSKLFLQLHHIFMVQRFQHFISFLE